VTAYGETALVVVPDGQPRRPVRAQQSQNINQAARAERLCLPWGYQSGAMFNNLVIFLQYCKKYGTSHDGLAPCV